MPDNPRLAGRRLPPDARVEAGLKAWSRTRSRVLAPDFVSKPVHRAMPARRRSFLRGAKCLGLMSSRKSLQPQQLLVADVLDQRCRYTVLLLPRRSSKTTTILAWLIGRCLAEGDLLCAYGVMTSQKVARRRFMTDVVPILERMYPDVKSRPFKLAKSNGAEAIVFRNGSLIMFYGPNPESFRSDAFDVIVLDEAGEIDGDDAEEVVAAAGPTQDTRPGAMLVYAGTAGKSTTGNMLWDQLAKSMGGDPRRQAVAYWADQNTLMEELAAWEPDEEHPNAHARELVELHHPGIGTLTTLDAVRDNFDNMKPEQFAREYLGIFTDVTGGNSLVNPDRWSKGNLGGTDEHPLPLPELPSRFGLAMVVHPDQLSAALVAAWRDDLGHACALVLDHRRGVDWVADRALYTARKYKLPIAHDTQGPVMLEVEWLQRQSPRPRLEPFTWPMVRTAAAGIIKEIERGNFQHWGQPTFNAAARDVAKRLSGPSNWALGPRGGDRTLDIIDLEGAMLALNLFDRKPARRFGALVA